MAWPIKVKNVEKEQISANGRAEIKISNQSGLEWSIPGTHNRPVDLTITAGYEGNKNNTYEVEVYRGESVSSTGHPIKSFQEKTKFSKSVSLPAEPGMVIIRAYQVKVGGMFGGFFEKFTPGMPGVTGKTSFKIQTETQTVPTGQPEENLPTNTVINRSRQSSSMAQLVPIVGIGALAVIIINS